MADSGTSAVDAKAICTAILGNLNKAIRGKREMMEHMVTCVAAGGHVLLEDIPGSGKTTLAKALAVSIGGVFKRVQFTPDLMPTDIVGASIYQPQNGTFTFRPGPVFANVLVTDEINRASPRTQSALLEAMSELQVTVDGTTHTLAPPFLCIATQNPVEFHGTYPLPEAQLDRFAMILSLGYPPDEDELALVEARGLATTLEGLVAVTTPTQVVELQRQASEVKLERSVADYILRIVGATRRHPGVRLGVSTRGAMVVARLARARALLNGRAFVVPDDVKAVAMPALAHRVTLDARARHGGSDRGAIIQEVLEKTAIPR